MFGSNVLEVGIGLIFTFLAVSLISGAIVEAIGSWTMLRAKTLLSGVQSLLNDPNFDALARQLYAHASINPRGPGASAPRANQPTYIDKEQFAVALMDITGISEAIAAHAAALATAEAAPPPAPAPAIPLVTRLTNAVDAKIAPPAAAPLAAPVPENPQIRQLLYGIIYRSLGDATKIKEDLASWFDNGMDRLSGVYKRYMQLMTVGIALILAVVINVDSITIAQEVWEQPTLVEKLKADKMITSDEALRALDQSLPVGWPNGYFKRQKAKQDDKGNPIKDDKGNPIYEVVVFGPWDWLVSICGWLITAVAALFGAPFWFDALQNITRLKGSGPSPDEKKNKTAAAS